MIIRFQYSKLGMMKYLGHLDLIRFFERAFRRLKLPLAFSQGYHPHPKMTFGGPLSVGVSSEYEIMEVELDRKINVADFMVRFNDFAPVGLKLIDYRPVAKSTSLMQAVSLIRYRVDMPAGQCDLVAAFAASDKIILRKKNKKHRWVDKDLKPFVAEIVESGDSAIGRRYIISIHSFDNGSAKPRDVIAILCRDTALDIYAVDITRTALFFSDSGQYKPLLEL
ncbi:MAG: hypothetical protein CSA13_01710 [Clostridiales bacterium]|nr:MAG: hypothetical protein CSA13_01710 [Clostridiales bacterium]